MAEPVVEQIMANVQARMDAAFETAYRATQVSSVQIKDAVVHVHQGDVTPNPELSCPGNPPVQAYDVEVTIAVVVKPSDKDKTPISTLRNRMGATIIVAATSAAMWHQWGGLAINTTHGPIEDYTEETGGYSGAMVRFMITYRVSEGDPYTARA